MRKSIHGHLYIIHNRLAQYKKYVVCCAGTGLVAGVSRSLVGVAAAEHRGEVAIAPASVVTRSKREI